MVRMLADIILIIFIDFIFEHVDYWGDVAAPMRIRLDDSLADDVLLQVRRLELLRCDDTAAEYIRRADGAFFFKLGLLTLQSVQLRLEFVGGRVLPGGQVVRRVAGPCRDERVFRAPLLGALLQVQRHWYEVLMVGGFLVQEFLWRDVQFKALNEHFFHAGLAVIDALLLELTAVNFILDIFAVWAVLGKVADSSNAVLRR